MSMLNRLSVPLAVIALVLAGCSSNAQLEDSADAVGTDGADQGTVVQVQTDDGTSGFAGQGPAGIAHTIYFDFDRYEVKPEYQSTVADHANFLRANANRSVVLEGNTDARGSREYNLALGQRRSEAVRRALTLLGASDSQIEAVSFGAENPVASGTGESAYAENRRVDFNYR